MNQKNYDMPIIRIITLLLFLSGASFTSLQAQPYQTGLGLRGPLGNGITLKGFISEKSALEGIMAFRYGGFNFTGLYEIHQNAFDVDNLFWFYGGGGHIGTWENAPWWDDRNSRTAVIGLDGILGIEYTFEDIPITASVDFKPAFNLVGDTGFWPDGGGISVRYLLNR